MKPIVTLEENTQGRDFVVGDIHGHFDLFDQALEAVNFNPEKDRIISVGDLVDRGPRSADCHKYLSKKWFYAVRGNHEQMFLDIYRDKSFDYSSVEDNHKLLEMTQWIKDEDLKTLDKIREKLENIPLALEIKTTKGIIAFVHADVPETFNWKDFKERLNKKDKLIAEFAMGSRIRFNDKNNQGVDGVFRIFLGHTPTSNGPKQLGNVFFIDTGAAYGARGTNSPEKSFLTLADIKANADDICAPKKTKHELVRIVTTNNTPKIN